MTPPGTNSVKIHGGGVIDGGGSFWWTLFHAHKLKSGRPRLIELFNTTNIDIGDITLRNSGLWTLHPVYSSDVWVHNVTILAPPDSPNTDVSVLFLCGALIIDNLCRALIQTQAQMFSSRIAPYHVATTTLQSNLALISMVVQSACQAET